MCSARLSLQERAPGEPFLQIEQQPQEQSGASLLLPAASRCSSRSLLAGRHRLRHERLAHASRSACVTLVIVKRSKPTGARQLPHCSFPLSAHVSHVAKRVRLYCVGRQVVKLLSMVALDFRCLFNCSKKVSHGEGSTIVPVGQMRVQFIMLPSIHLGVWLELKHPLMHAIAE